MELARIIYSKSFKNNMKRNQFENVKKDIPK